MLWYNCDEMNPKPNLTRRGPPQYPEPNQLNVLGIILMFMWPILLYFAVVHDPAFFILAVTAAPLSIAALAIDLIIQFFEARTRHLRETNPWRRKK